jgi:hypothetical protein
MKKQNFKKLGITLIALFIAITTFLPTKANAQTVDEVIDIIEIIIDTVCPDVPQNRCKQNTCQSGACFSFRPACEGSGSC